MKLSINIDFSKDKKEPKIKKPKKENSLIKSIKKARERKVNDPFREQKRSDTITSGLVWGSLFSWGPWLFCWWLACQTGVWLFWAINVLINITGIAVCIVGISREIDYSYRSKEDRASKEEELNRISLLSVISNCLMLIFSIFFLVAFI